MGKWVKGGRADWVFVGWESQEVDLPVPTSAAALAVGATALPSLAGQVDRSGFERFDLDHSGAITLSEFARLDRNGDGVVGLDEFRRR